jgi:hypothetical protein
MIFAFFLKNGYLVPELASKLLLIEERSIGTDEACTSGAVPPVIAHPVHLNRNSSLPVPVFRIRKQEKQKLTPKKGKI